MENQARWVELIESQEVDNTLIEFLTLPKNKLLGISTRINRVIIEYAGIAISHQIEKIIESGIE